MNKDIFDTTLSLNQTSFKFNSLCLDDKETSHIIMSKEGIHVTKDGGITFEDINMPCMIGDSNSIYGLFIPYTRAGKIPPEVFERVIEFYNKYSGQAQ